MGPGPYDPFQGPATELVILLMGTLAVLGVCALADIAWRRWRSRDSRSDSGGPDLGV